jgi:aminoglycoside phosphotransferase (APT) family kinase protein
MIIGMDEDPRSLVDLDRLTAWMDAEGLSEGPIERAQLIAGGTQNILLRFRRDAQEYVLRRPPLHKRANSDETMRREARVLAALRGTPVPHPELIGACGDPDVLGAAFYIMQPVDGFNATVEVPPSHQDPAVQHGMGLAMADGIASLAKVDFQAAGIGDLGRADGWMERQVPRWKAQLDSYAEFEGYSPASLPGLDRVGAWLDEHRPSTWQPGVMHGDYSLANVLFRLDGPELAAIVDWELATIGNPLLDLGHLLALWPDEEGRGVAFDVELHHLPERPELVARYAETSGRDVTDATWYQVLACYRLGIILEGTHARACAGKAPVATGDRLHSITLGLFAQASELIDGA